MKSGSIGLLLASLVVAGPSAGEVMQCDAPFHEQPATEVRIEITGIPDPVGQIRIGIYASAARFTQDGGTVCRGIVAARGETASTATFSLRRGWYAIAVGHDRNENGEVDRILIPTEAYGFSNYPLVPFGRPLFEQARFEVADPHQVVKIPVSFHPTLRSGRAVPGARRDQR